MMMWGNEIVDFEVISKYCIQIISNLYQEIYANTNCYSVIKGFTHVDCTLMYQIRSICLFSIVYDISKGKILVFSKNSPKYKI